MTTTGKPSVSDGWDTYWQETGDVDSYASDGARHPAITAFWDDSLSPVMGGANLRVLDIATGSGAVVDSLFRNAANAQPNITCVDISAAAVESVSERYPSVATVVADARAVPLEDERFDLITSQFGIEYAGADAFDEAARLLAPGGTLLMLMHIRPGVIYKECWTSLDAVRRMKQSKFLPLALDFFEAGFAAVRGADRAPYDKAGVALNPALRKVERILSDHGDDVAGGTVSKLYTDIERIHTRIQHYEPAEVTEWLRQMMVELDAYEARMESMCNSALDKKAFRKLRKRLEEKGLSITAGKPLLPGKGSLPVAWVLHAVRKNGD